MANGRTGYAFVAGGWVGLLVLVGAMLSPPSVAASSADVPDSENGRYAFHAGPDGVLRLDRKNGDVSTCTKQAAGWACYLVADERAALESEIARLSGENGRLKEALLANKLPLPGLRGPDAGKAPNGVSKADDYSIEISGPGIDKLKAFAQQAWKRISGAFGTPR